MHRISFFYLKQEHSLSPIETLHIFEGEFILAVSKERRTKRVHRRIEKDNTNFGHHLEDGIMAVTKETRKKTVCACTGGDL